MFEMNQLQQEIKTFRSIKSELLAESKGRFALIKKNKLIGIFINQIDAINQGFIKFKNTPFLVKQILDSEPIYNIFNASQFNINL